MSQSRHNERHWPQSQPQRPPTALDNVRNGIASLFSGYSRVGSGREQQSQVPESPKTPRLPHGGLPSTRHIIPHLTRTSTNPDPSPPTRSRAGQSRQLPFSSFRSRPATPHDPPQEISPVRPIHRRYSTRRFVGVDPAEVQLAELAHSGRRRQSHKGRRGDIMCWMCAPKIKNKKIRAKILSCFVSGMVLALVLTIYLALALSNRDESQEFHVLLILIILITTVFFCHALIRLCMMIINPPDDSDMRQNLPSMIGPGGYANPSTPIPVALARDEEAVGIKSEATKMPPPAYGLWRESVRVDPNRIFWQKNESAALQRQKSTGAPRPVSASANRPPSYISENGVDYVIEAAPRSIAPTTDVPLPPHPSDRRTSWPARLA